MIGVIRTAIVGMPGRRRHLTAAVWVGQPRAGVMRTSQSRAQATSVKDVFFRQTVPSMRSVNTRSDLPRPSSSGSRPPAYTDRKDRVMVV